MTSGEHIRANSEKVRQFWHRRGSWLLLALVGVTMFLAGNGFHAHQTEGTIQILQTSFDKKEETYRARIRELNDEIKTYLPLAAQAGKVASETQKDVQETKQAVQSLTNKLDTSDKGDSNGKDNSEASRP